MARQVISTARTSESMLTGFLNLAGPRFAEIYAARRYAASAAKKIPPVSLAILADQNIEEIAAGMRNKIPLSGSKGAVINLLQPQVIQVTTDDMEKSDDDKRGCIIVATTTDDLVVCYGERGVAASATRLPADLLTNNLVVPKGILGVLDIENHRPFTLLTQNADKSFAMAACQLTRVPSHEEIKRFSLNVVTNLTSDLAKRTAIKMQDRIFSDRGYEMFYKEVTSKVYQPTEFNRSSGTLMNFERSQFGVDNTTDMHFHPGERVILIFTTNKEAGATLNFCGIAENPDLRPDCEERLQFKENAISILTFPPYTHHKFHGEFVCISFHPREGANLIEAVKNGTLPKGFLESAAIFSNKETSPDAWKLSPLQTEGNPTPQPKSSTARQLVEQLAKKNSLS